MKDTIIDFFYQAKDKIQELFWWIQDNVKTFLTIVLISSVVIIGTLGVLNSKKGETDKIDKFSEEHLSYLTKESEMMDKMFLNLNEDTDYQLFGASPSSLIDIDKSAVLTYDFYVRKPFTDEQTIEDTLNNFLEMVKLQTRAKGYKLKMLEVNLYFRKELFDEGVSPSGTYRYMLDYNKLDIKKLEKENKYINSSVEDIAKSETQSANKIKTNNYTTYFDYKPLSQDKSAVGLTDEEFATYLKLDKYVALAGGFDAGIKLYLHWELGANIKDKSYTNIVEQFYDFQNRLSDVGEKTAYFSDGYNLVVLQDRMVIENPQLLLFKESKTIVTDPTEARKQLLEDYASDYEYTLVKFAEKQGSLYNEYNKVYEPATPTFINNLTNTQKISNGFVDKNGFPLRNIDYEEYFKGNISERGKVYTEEEKTKNAEKTDKDGKATEKIGETREEVKEGEKTSEERTKKDEKGN